MFSLVSTGCTCKQIFLYYGCSNKTTSSIKKKLVECCKIYNCQMYLILGGKGDKVGGDETFIGRKV